MPRVRLSVHADLWRRFILAHAVLVVESPAPNVESFGIETVAQCIEWITRAEAREATR